VQTTCIIPFDDASRQKNTKEIGSGKKDNEEAYNGKNRKEKAGE
jgi:hypothetical protein